MTSRRTRGERASMHPARVTGMRRYAILLVGVIGCGGGSSDGATGDGGMTSSTSSSSSSSSGGGSSSGGSSSGGAETCAAICSTYASVTFDEPNEGGRLEGARLSACFRDACARGTIVRSDAGRSQRLEMTPTSDAGSIGLEVRTRSSPTPGSLQFEVRWDLGAGTGSATNAIEGDRLTVSARIGEDGQELFAHDYTAKYVDARECGSTCKVFEAKP